MDIKIAQRVSDLAMKQRSDFSSVVEFMIKYYLKNEGEGTAEILTCPKCDARYSSELNKCPNCATKEAENEIKNKQELIAKAEQDEKINPLMTEKTKLVDQIRFARHTMNRLKGENRNTEAADIKQQIDVMQARIKEIDKEVLA